MIDISQMNYRVVLVPESGSQLNITNIVDSLGWEENKGEMAMRVNVTLKNQKYNGKNISDIAKLNCIIGVFAQVGSINEEVARGRIITWETSTTSSKDTIKLTCYDESYDLQKSYDNIYYPEGTGTRTAILTIFDNWRIPLDKYNGPNESHSKLVFKNKSICDIMIEILDDAQKKASEHYLVRCSKGKISVLPRGSNNPVYHFGEDNSTTVRNQWSTADMVTRVKVIGQEDDDGNSSVEATVDGKTQYGIRQKIIIRGKDDELQDAKDSANEILEDKGDVQKTITVEAPDIPFIRKGDLVHITAGSVNAYHYVKGIRHDADTMKMSMDLDNAKEASSKVGAPGSSGGPSGEFNKGDKVTLNGAVYVDSYGSKKGKTFSNYKGTITKKVDTKRVCPYHVDHIGWVYPNTIKKA